jgi:hypothetical protein
MSDVDVMVIGGAGLADLSPSLRKAEARLGREVNVTAYSPEEFREKTKSGDHFLATVKAAEAEGVALNQLINVAVAEKVSALRTQEYFRERGRRADRAETLRILGRAGQRNRPMEGDELPPEWRKKPGRKVANERDSAKRGQKKRAAVK